jgi:hypothetical protein
MPYPVPVIPVGFALPPRAAFLADDLDPLTGELLSLVSGIDPTDSAVVTAVRSERGAGAAVLTVGQRFGDVEKSSSSAAKEIEYEALEALRALVSSGDIDSTISITTSPESSEAGILIEYTNNRTGVKKEVSL